ncbi:SGNH/GDSL hydrolase family protein [Streptomyces hainanensis]|uniref:SGNH/GDSL hydrolase family protein n=1 Tax=Streptomyces hainanensis TaxID=402648 RepID=A0A4R4SSH8_9ACTN|nr:SGNH/GDSL hydrolase family protein [Streptomyces hainanensis]
MRFVTLGDSLTEGVGDPVPGGWRGWAPLLAAGLTASESGRPARLTNLARSGARTADAAGDQLAAARRIRPHLAGVIIGGNDTLRSAFDIAASARDLDTVIGTLSREGTLVLTACLPDPGGMLHLPTALTRPLARRMTALNDVVHQLSRRHGAVHVHLAGHPVAATRAAWSVDRLHPSELGHRLLAREFHAALADRGVATGTAPTATTDRPPPTRAACFRWLATRGTNWVLARATDLLPGLVGLAVRETRHRLAGTAHTLDAASHAATRAALAGLGPRSGAAVAPLDRLGRRAAPPLSADHSSAA